MDNETQQYLNQLPGELASLRDCLAKGRKELEKERYGEAFDAIVTAHTRAALLYRSFPIMLLSAPPTRRG